MVDEHLATYLNDHLAGSLVAIELLEHLERAHKEEPIAQFIAELRADIVADQRELQNLMKQLAVEESRTRKTGAWISEKFTEVKLRVDDRSGGVFRLFEAFEALALGIEGKRVLWETLASLSDDQPSLHVLDYPRLMARAREQRDRVDRQRLALAKATLVAVDPISRG